MIAVTVSGRVGRDAELRNAGQTQVLSFTLCSSGFRNKEKTSDWCNVSLFGKRGESVAQYVTKGSFVVVRGLAFLREYDGKDGIRKACLEVRADDVELGGSGGGERQQSRSAHGGAAKHHEDAPLPAESFEDPPF